ncbi:tetratricopeptide repeat protein [Crateriforma conspicua]|uniref:Tetratricopeptide repeat protein n=1 Tax=Crateriforma conspicua TaxID=2527996 RepID=A0A5C6FTM5_9PLAN|nr:tetratricopeptide repeat protein [Crateriforma conspicua]
MSVMNGSDVGASAGRDRRGGFAATLPQHQAVGLDQLIQQLSQQAVARYRTLQVNSGDASAAALTATAVHQHACRRLRKDAECTTALNVCAIELLRQGHGRRATELLHSSPGSLHHDDHSLLIVALASLADEDLAAAETMLIRSVDCQPNQAMAWLILARIYRDQGNADRAIAYFERGLLLDPEHGDAAIDLARLYVGRRQVSAAISTLRPALARHPRSAALNETFAALLLRRAAWLRRLRRINAATELSKKALRHLRIAVQSRPTAELWARIGTGELRRENFTAARQAFESALALNPDFRPAATRLATLDVDQGNIDGARSQFDRLVQQSDSSALAHFRYSRIRKFKPDDQSNRYLTELRRRLAKADQPVEQTQWLYTIAKVCDDCGDFDQAWDAYRQANQIKMRRMRPDESGRMAGIVDDAIAAFDADTFQHFAGIGHGSQQPIFIVGMPRSGTTLTEQILSCHSLIDGAGELKDLERLRCRMFRAWHQRMQSSGSFRGPVRAVKYHNGLPFAQAEDFKQFQMDYLEQLSVHQVDGQYVTDKMPTNFMHLGLVALCFPNARIIHCRRDPMDILASSMCQNLTPPFCDPDTLADYYIQYRRMMDHWRRVVPNRLVEVDYEKLASDSESQIRRVFTELEIPFQDACLRFHENDRSVHTPSKFQVRQPMYATSIGKWKRFERQLKPIAERLQQASTD